MSEIEDLFQIISFFSPYTFGSYSSFTRNYCNLRRIPIGGMRFGRLATRDEIVSYKNIDALRDRLSDAMISYFPPQTIRFRKHVGQLRNKADYDIAAAGLFEGAGKKTKGEAKQHSVRLVDLQEVVNKDEGKLQAFLLCLKERIAEGCLVFCSYYDTVDVVFNILQRCKINYKEISGRTEDRKAVKEWFVKDSRNKVLVITKAGSASLNLQATPNIIFFDTPFGAGSFQQAIGRVVRKYSDHKEFNVDFIVAEGTIDEYKYNLLAANRELFAKILGNEMVPPSQKLTSFNQYIIDQLKRDCLWNRRPRAKK